MSRLAAMQPYFLPYPGYFSLLVRSEVLVVLDEDQYVPRRWMNRTKVSTEMGTEWLTLPISGEHGTRISLRDCVVATDTVSYLKAERKYSQLVSGSIFAELPAMGTLGENLVQINMQLIEDVSNILGLAMPLVVYWSDLKSSILYEGNFQNRAIALTKHFDCKTYLNPSGGRHLYDRDLFYSFGLNLEFMDPFVESESDTLSVVAQSDSGDSITKRINERARSSE